MENVIMTEKEAAILKEKADKWDKLGEKIAKFYCDKDGEYNEDAPEQDGDLCDIGEVAAMAYGWL